jgi:cysteine desulfuration protein SufE
MSETFQKKSGDVKTFFVSLSSSEARYGTLIQMGRDLPSFSLKQKIPENLVSGCQSNLYLTAHTKNGHLFFEAASDSLISSGLAALLISVYSGETPETILKEPPHFLTEIGIFATLSPNRSYGLSHIYLRMKELALKSLITPVDSFA